MKLATVTALNKVGQKYTKHYLLCDSNIHRDAQNMVFSSFGVSDYNQKNAAGNMITSIDLSDDIGWILGASGNELVEIVLAEKANA